jgi:hypothetical protein
MRFADRTLQFLNVCLTACIEVMAAAAAVKVLTPSTAAALGVEAYQ